jgi:hypothetical protein
MYRDMWEGRRIVDKHYFTDRSDVHKEVGVQVTHSEHGTEGDSKKSGLGIKNLAPKIQLIYIYYFEIFYVACIHTYI